MQWYARAASFFSSNPLILFPEASVLCHQLTYLNKVLDSCAPRGNCTRFYLEWTSKFSKECQTKNENIFIKFSVLEDETFSDIWEFNVLIWVFSLLYVRQQNWGSEGRIQYFFLVLVYLHFWLQLKWNAKRRLEEIYITNNERLPVF